MRKREVVDLEAMFKALRKPRFGNLDADVGLWLLWRRSIGKPVAAKVAEEIIPGVTVPLIENFFSSKYGIGQIPLENLNLDKICDLYQIKLSEKQAMDLIEGMEKKCGEKADTLMQNVRKRRGRI